MQEWKNMKEVGPILSRLALPQMSVGHFVPSKANWRNFFRDYLRDPLGEVPSPSSGATSQSNSGTATPVTPASNL